MSDTHVQSLSDLLSRYLDRQVRDEADGLTGGIDSEVLPFEAAPVQPVDARLAWTEALASASYFGVDLGMAKAPPDWPTVVNAHEPVMSLAMGVGNFPQLVRDLHGLMNAADRAKLLPRKTSRSVPVPALVEWSQNVRTIEDCVIALGALRLAKQFEAAKELAAVWQARVPQTWSDAWSNELAVLAWQSGDCEVAKSLWQQLPESVPVLFNRGMAEIFGGDAGQAKILLERAIARIGETSAWHHLGRLYLALTE